MWFVYFVVHLNRSGVGEGWGEGGCHSNWHWPLDSRGKVKPRPTEKCSSKLDLALTVPLWCVNVLWEIVGQKPKVGRNRIKGSAKTISGFLKLTCGLPGSFFCIKDCQQSIGCIWMSSCQFSTDKGFQRSRDCSKHSDGYKGAINRHTKVAIWHPKFVLCSSV